MKTLHHLSLVVILFGATVGCDGSSQSPAGKSLQLKASYKPLFLPITISVNSDGQIAVGGDATLATPIGTFAIGGDYTLNPESGFTYVIVRDRRQGKSGTDTVYRVNSGDRELSFVFIGETKIQVSDRRVLVDVSDGNSCTIRFPTEDKDSEIAKVTSERDAMKAELERERTAREDAERKLKEGAKIDPKSEDAPRAAKSHDSPKLKKYKFRAKLGSFSVEDPDRIVKQDEGLVEFEVEALTQAEANRKAEKIVADMQKKRDETLIKALDAAEHGVRPAPASSRSKR